MLYIVESVEGVHSFSTKEKCDRVKCSLTCYAIIGCLNFVPAFYGFKFVSKYFFCATQGKKTTYKNNLLIKTQIIVWMSNYMRQNRDEISVSLTGALAPDVCLIL